MLIIPLPLPLLIIPLPLPLLIIPLPLPLPLSLIGPPFIPAHWL